MLDSGINAGYAAPSAEMVCVKPHVGVSHDGKKCDTFELRVNILPDKDLGLVGELGIIAVSENTHRLAYWTADAGWSPYTDERLLKPVQQDLKKITSKNKYITFTGSGDDLCKLSNGHNFNVYAWYAGLNGARFNQIDRFMKKFEIEGWQAENLWNSLFFYEANMRKQVKRLYSHTCPPQ